MLYFLFDEVYINLKSLSTYNFNRDTIKLKTFELLREGLRFLDHQDKVKESASGTDGGRRYKEQLDKIHCIVVNSTC